MGLADAKTDADAVSDAEQELLETGEMVQIPGVMTTQTDLSKLRAAAGAKRGHLLRRLGAQTRTRPHYS